MRSINTTDVLALSEQRDLHSLGGAHELGVQSCRRQRKLLARAK